MLQAFLSPGDWFAPKRYGYGAGLPIAWQGWALLLSYVLATIGVAALVGNSGGAPGTALALISLLTVPLILIARRRTRGGWRWRWGERD